jgi:hypothetical protein
MSTLANVHICVPDRVCGNMLVAGRLTIPIQRSYRLDEVPNAFADFAAGTLGKLAVTVA